MQLDNHLAKLKRYRLIIIVFYIYLNAIDFFCHNWNVVPRLVQFFDDVTIVSIDVDASYQWCRHVANNLRFNQTAVDVQGIESSVNVRNIHGQLFKSKYVSQLRLHCALHVS